MMNQETFDHLWEQVATHETAARLARDFRPWERRVRRRRHVAMSLAVVCAVGLTVLLSRPAPARGYDQMACNRKGYTDQYCLSVANEMLRTQV